MVVQLGDEFGVAIPSIDDDRGGTVYQIELVGSIDDPDSVKITLHTGTSFEIPWKQYKQYNE